MSQAASRDVASILAIVSFIAAFCLIGFPVWWKTTTVYRVSLPYSEIEDLANLEISHVVPVTVVLSDRSIQQSSLFEELYRQSNDGLIEPDDAHYRIKYAWKMRTTLEEEDSIIQSSESPEEIDNLLHKASPIDEAGVYQILVVDDSKLTRTVTKVVGCHRRGYVFSDAGSSVVKDVISVVRAMVQEDMLKKIYVPVSYERKRPGKERMRSLSTTTAFDITFSLVIPEPHVLDVHWDIERAVEAYIMPFIRKLAPVAQVNIKSQILYMTTLPIEAEMRGVKDEYYVTFEQLPTLMNPVEGRLAAYASTNTNLNFITYIPPQSQSPLHILDKRGDVVETNAYMLPQWGGVLIKNVRPVVANEKHPQKVSLDMKEVMEVFLGQLRLLLGLPEDRNSKDPSVAVMHNMSGCEWELDFLMRKNIQEQLSVAASSLHSLGQLLQKINNIVIRDDVGEKVYTSVSSIKNSLGSLEQGFLEDSFVASKNAFEASESAFYDPSLLSLLYFPEDQKYAVYIPLFLPISLPVLISVRHLWTYFYCRHKEKKE